MFKSKSVIVVGAGASSEIGLPLGGSLTEKIRSLLQIQKNDDGHSRVKDRHIQAVLYTYVRSKQSLVGDLWSACQMISEGMEVAQSIDSFLDAHAGNIALEICSKLAIAHTIISAERSSSLYVDESNAYNRPNLSRLRSTWYFHLWNTLSAGVQRDNIDRIFANVTFIVFNYDRCLEQFLFWALMSYYQVDSRTAALCLKRVRFFHPYGQVGPMIDTAFDAYPVSFGEMVHHDTLFRVSQSIRTFSERIEDQKEVDAMRTAVAVAQKLVFLGFAYHEQNMKLLTPQGACSAKNIYGTCYGLSSSDQDVVRDRITNLLRQDGPESEMLKVRLSDKECCGMFQEYSLSISD